MKRSSLALHRLISTPFPGDDLELITAGRHARSVELAELIGVEGITIFRLGDGRRLTRFVDAEARWYGGKVVAPTLDGLEPWWR